MSINWDLYSTRLKIDGNTLRDRHINSMKSTIESSFESNPSYYQVYINGSTSTIKVNIVDENAISNNPNKKRMLSLPDETFNVGDLISWNSENWLVTNIDADKTIETAGIIEKCNNTLKFYNKDNETGISWVLTQIPCIVTTPFKTNMGEDETRYITNSVTDYQVIIPDNLTTDIIDSGTRFILKGLGSKVRAFECKGYDDISANGLKTIKISRCEFNSDDDKVNCIADKQKYTNVYSINLISSSIVDLNYLNQTAKIELECFINGIKDVSPTLLITNSNNSVCTIDADTLIITAIGTGQSTITISYGTISTTITVNGTLVENNNLALSITGSDSIKVSQQSTYVANVTNNGVTNMARPIVWELFADDEISNTTLGTILFTSGTYNENCIIKSNSNNQYGYIKLKAKTDTNSCNNFKRINIRSLL